MRKSSPQVIGDILKNVVEGLDRVKKKDSDKVLAAWSAVCGRELARHTRPASLHKGNLLVNVRDSAWFYQASLEKDKLLAALKKRLGEKKIQRIQFRIGKI